MLKLVTVIFFVLSLFMNTMCSKLRQETNNCAGKIGDQCYKIPNCTYDWDNTTGKWNCNYHTPKPKKSPSKW